MMKNEKGFVQIILIIVVVVAIIAALIFLGKDKLSSFIKIGTPVPSAVFIPTPSIDPTASWKIYTNDTYRFLIRYPAGWTSQSEGDVVDTWQVVSSPDRAPKGSQSPVIGMNVNIQVTHMDKPVSEADFKQFEAVNGISVKYKVNKISEKLTLVDGFNALTYEYEGTESPYLYHFWGDDIARGNEIISVSITDFRADSSLNTKEIAGQILSTFKFTQ